MPVQKIDPKVIFASNAPAIDKPPVFSDKTKGWDISRKNDGRPEIKEMNKLQQDTDLKILWLNENAVTPYDSTIDYPEGHVSIKDGDFKKLNKITGEWSLFIDKEQNNIHTVESIADLILITDMKDGDVVYVISIQKKYIYNSLLTTPENGVTVVDKWEMELQRTYYASWFAKPNTPDISQTENLQIGSDYATSKKSSFIIDDNYYVYPSSLDAWTMQPENKQCLVIKSNSVTVFLPTGKLTIIPNDLPHYNIIAIKENIENYVVINAVVVGDIDEHTYSGETTHEWGHGITIPSSTNGYFLNPKVYKCTGDGFYINRLYWSNYDNMPKDITITNLYVDGIGRNGVSLCGAENLYIDGFTVKNVQRISPYSGIDIEPEQEDGHKPSTLKNVTVNNFTAIDCKAALNIALGSTVANRDAYEVNVNFTGITTFIGCSRQFVYAQFLNDFTAPYDLNAKINMQELHSDLTVSSNFLEGNMFAKNPILSISDAYINTPSGELLIYITSSPEFNTVFNSLNIQRIHMDSSAVVKFSSYFSSGISTYYLEAKLGFPDDVNVQTVYDVNKTISYGQSSNIGGYDYFLQVSLESHLSPKNAKITVQNDGVGNYLCRVNLLNNATQWKTYIFNETSSAIPRQGYVYILIGSQKYGCNIMGGRFTARMINGNVEFKDGDFSLIP